MAIGRRRMRVLAGDKLVINGYEIDGDILQTIVNPEARLLWAFIKSEDGASIQPVSYREDRVIWLTQEDLVRSEVDV